MFATLAITFLSAATACAQPQIVGIECSQEANKTRLTFTANGAIGEFQKPETTKGRTTFRFVNCTIAPELTVPGCSDVEVTHKQIREFAVFTVGTNIVEASVKRVSTSVVCLTVTTSQTNIEQTTTATTKSSQSKPWALDVIVIDAGHGGKDLGATGVNGVHEKDVTLAIAKKVQSMIQAKLPDTKVVMTRDDDTFIELYRRTQIANEAKGKLFVSIHCNSMPTIPHPANGCETYILRPGRNADAARVAEQENASIKLEKTTTRYAGLDADQLIVATMAQRSFVRYSEELASRIQKHVAASTGLHNRGVNQAGFYVLVGASMPNVLFETAFLSNEGDAAFISSARGQHKTASAILHAIIEYAEMYESSLH